MVFISASKIEKHPPDVTFPNTIITNANSFVVDKAHINQKKDYLEEIKLNNIPAIKIITILSPGFGNPTTAYYLKNNNNNFSITFENDDLNGDHNPIFDQILSTFKFLD